MRRSRSMVIALLGMLCAIGASAAVSDQFAVFGIDRGVGAVGTFRAPVGQPVVPGAATVMGTDSQTAGSPSSAGVPPYWVPVPAKAGGVRPAPFRRPLDD